MHCPLCDYDLTGLPAEHTCPECGFRYDPHATAVKLAVRKRHYAQVVMAAGLIYLALSSREPGMGFLIVGVMLGVIAAAFRLAKTAGRPCWLILTRAGIRLEHPELGVRLFDWDDVTEAKYSWMTGAFQIRGSAEEARFRYRYDRLGTPRIARRCAKEINRLRPIYLAEAEAVSHGEGRADRAEALAGQERTRGVSDVGG